MQAIREELQPLDTTEAATAQRIRKKKLMYWANIAGAMTLVLIAGFILGPGGGRGYKVSEQQRQLHYSIGPYILTGYLLILFGFLFFYYRRSIHPFSKDLAAQTKRVIFFHPESYRTPYFDNFYLVTGNKKRPMLRISQEMYNAIQPGTTAQLYMLPSSRFILSLVVGNEKMEFNEKNTILDL